MSSTPYTNRPLVALRALHALTKDPDDLARVFTVIDALPGRSPFRTIRLMRESKAGRQLLAARPDLRAVLTDRAALQALPEGSLGRAYLAFVDREGITAQGIVAASEGSEVEHGAVDRDMAWVGERMRDTHDLWHVVTGYNADLVGETALLGFIFAQTMHPGIAFVGSLAYIRGLPGASMFADGFRRGRRAAWLPAVAWETLLERPLDEVQHTLAVEPAPAYTPLTSRELREAGFLPARAA